MKVEARKILYDISPKEWEHPADAAALVALKRLPFLGELLKKIIGFTSEKALHMLALGSSVRVGERQFPGLHTVLLEACEILDVREVPELYVAQSPVMNAGAIGTDTPFITVNSSLAGALPRDELMVVIGHELGHILSGHVLYKTLLWFLANTTLTGLGPAVSRIAMVPLLASLREWDRKSEYSADRAGVLAAQEAGVAYNTLMRMAGGNQLGEMNLESFLEQAAAYESGGDVIDSVHKLFNTIGRSHPFPVLRLQELKAWIDAGEMDQILGGKYIRRGGEGRSEGDEFMNRVREAAEEYRRKTEASGDPLEKTLHDIGRTAEQAGREAAKFVSDVMEGLFSQPNRGRNVSDEPSDSDD